MLTEEEQRELARIRDYYHARGVAQQVKMAIVQRDVAKLVTWIMLLQDQVASKEKEMAQLRRSMLA